MSRKPDERDDTVDGKIVVRHVREDTLPFVDSDEDNAVPVRAITAPVVTTLTLTPSSALLRNENVSAQNDWLKIVENYLVLQALIAEWLNVFFGAMQDQFHKAPSQEDQQGWKIPVPIIILSMVLIAATEILNRQYAKKKSGRSLGAHNALIALCSGPFVFFLIQLFLGVETIPLWLFSIITLGCFGAFIRRCLSVNSDGRMMPFKEFDQLKREECYASLSERCGNAIVIGGKAALSISALLVTLRRETKGKTEPLMPSGLEVVAIFFLWASHVGYELNHAPKMADLTSAALTGGEVGAMVYRALSGLFYMAVAYIFCGGKSFCANQDQQDILTCICLPIALFFARRSAMSTQLNFALIHEENLKTLDRLARAAEKAKNSLCNVAYKAGGLFQDVKKCCGLTEDEGAFAGNVL